MEEKAGKEKKKEGYQLQIRKTEGKRLNMLRNAKRCQAILLILSREC